MIGLLQRCSVLAALLLAGCGGTLKLGRPLMPTADDWPGFGRSPEHTGTALREIQPPLELAWTYDLSAGTADGAPIIVDSVLFAGTLRGELHAIDVRTGKRLGWVSLGDAIHGTPAVKGMTIYVPLANTEKSLVAFDLGNGKNRWQRPLGEIEASVVFSDQRLYVGTLDGVFFCIDAASGETLWKFPLPDNSAVKGIRSTAAVSAASVFIGADDGMLYALDRDGGRLRWSRRTGAPVTAAITCDSAAVVAANLDGGVIAVTPDSGRVLWTFSAGQAVRAHVLLTPDLAVVATTGGTVCGLDRTSGTPRWSVHTGGPVSGGAVAAGRYLYVGTQKRECLALRANDGALVWKTSVGGRVKTSPVTAFDRLFIVTDDKTLLAFRGSPTP